MVPKFVTGSIFEFKVNDGLLFLVPPRRACPLARSSLFRRGDDLVKDTLGTVFTDFLDKRLNRVEFKVSHRHVLRDVESLLVCPGEVTLQITAVFLARFACLKDDLAFRED